MSAEWPTKLLGEMVTHKKGFAFKSSDYQDEGIPVIRVSNFTDDSISATDLKFVSKATAQLNFGVALKANDIVVATVGSWPNNPASVVGRTISVPAWVSGGLMNQNSVIVRTRSGEPLDQAFIYYQMKSAAFASHVISKAQGSANQASITLDAIFSFPIWWPGPTDRQMIAESLASLDDRITLLRETNATLEAIAQALFKSWFVDFDPVRSKLEGRAPEGMDEATARLFPDSLEESELGLVPRGWRVGQVADLGDVICGKTPPTAQPENYGGDVPFITIPDMHNLLAVTATNRSLSRIGADTQKKKYLPPGSICISCIATPGLVVRVTVEAQTNQQINSVVPLECWGKAFPLFLLRRIGEAVRAGGSGGSVFHNLSKSGFEELKVLLTSSELAQRFDEVIEPLVRKIVSNQTQAQTLATLRDTLLPRLISGQLRLPEAAALLEGIAA